MGLNVGETIRTEGEALADIALVNGLGFRIGGDAMLTLQPDNRPNLESGDMITAALYERVRDQVEVIPVGTYPLRGRQGQPIELFSVIGLKGQDPSLYQQVQQELHNYFKTAGRFTQNGDR